MRSGPDLHVTLGPHISVGEPGAFACILLHTLLTLSQILLEQPQFCAFRPLHWLFSFFAQ